MYSQSTLTSGIRCGEPNKPGKSPVSSMTEENIITE